MKKLGVFTRSPAHHQGQHKVVRARIVGALRTIGPGKGRIGGEVAIADPQREASANLDFKADEKTGALAAKASYEVIALEKVGPYDTAKIKWTYAESEGETKASSEGFVWLWTLDGSLVKAEGKLKNAPFRDAPRPVDVDILTEREP